MAAVTINEDTVAAVSPEGVRAEMPLQELIARLAAPPIDAEGLIWPDGTKAMPRFGSVTVLIHETPPQVYNLQWIANDSPAPFGPCATYRTVRIALPYLVILAVFQHRRGRYVLAKHNECFFRIAPFQSLDDELCYPALLNCSKFDPQEGKPLSWICSQHMDRSGFDTEKNSNKRIRAALFELRKTLLDAGFNRSSEFHEASSWFTESAKQRIDPRVATIESWEEATRADPLFVLDVPWLPTRKSARQIVERIYKNHDAGRGQTRTAADVARIIFNHQQPNSTEQ